MVNANDGIVGTTGSKPVCAHCGSKRVAKDAWAKWNPESGRWELEAVFDAAHCHACEGETSLEWIQDFEITTPTIRELNDQFRSEGKGNGTVVVTQGVEARGRSFIQEALLAVRSFADFTKDNDPYGEHDFGMVEIDNQRLFWKIDYYDLDLTGGSEDPANGMITHRVLTIMLASEY